MPVKCKLDFFHPCNSDLNQDETAVTVLIPNSDVPFNITRLSHIVLTSRDLEKTRFFYETGLGFEVTEHDDSMRCLRAIEETGHHSLVFEKINTEGPRLCCRIGYRMFSDNDLKRAFDHFSAQGRNTAFVERPYQGLTLQLNDAVGVPI
ncbi:MAG: catechol 2,3-dioxygenase [Granulosicoccus sp.]